MNHIYVIYLQLSQESTTILNLIPSRGSFTYYLTKPIYLEIGEVVSYLNSGMCGSQIESCLFFARRTLDSLNAAFRELRLG